MAINLKQNATGAGQIDFVSDLTSRKLFEIKERGAAYSDLVSKVTLFDDFEGDVIDSKWGVRKGSDPQCVDFAIAAAISGTIAATTGDDAAADHATNGVQLERALNWKAAQGNLVLEAKVKISAITNVAIFVGFTDQVSSLEEPASLSGTTYTTTATDAVGFLFDTAATTDTIRAVGVANNVDATHVDTGLAYVADTYRTLRIEVDTSGTATFFVDGARVASVASAVTTSVALTPVITATARAAASRTVTADYIFVQQDR